MSISDVQASARADFARGECLAAQRTLSLAGASRPLVPSELELLGQATWLLGDVPGSMAQSEQAFDGYMRAGERDSAAALAIRLSLEWSIRGDLVVASAWMGRARRILGDDSSSLVSGYLDYVQATYDLLMMELEIGPDIAEAAATRVADLAAKFGDPTLACFSLVLNGLAAIVRGNTQRLVSPSSTRSCSRCWQVSWIPAGPATSIARSSMSVRPSGTSPECGPGPPR